jgi:hypothetical protein
MGFKGSAATNLSARIGGTRVYLSLASFRSDGLGGPALQMKAVAIPQFPPVDEAVALALCTVPVPIPDRDITKANLANRVPFDIFSEIYPHAHDPLDDSTGLTLRQRAGYNRYGARSEYEVVAAVERWFDDAVSWARLLDPANVISRIDEFERSDPRAPSGLARGIVGGIRLLALISLGRIDGARSLARELRSYVSDGSPSGRTLLSLLPRLEDHIGYSASRRSRSRVTRSAHPR